MYIRVRGVHCASVSTLLHSYLQRMFELKIRLSIQAFACLILTFGLTSSQSCDWNRYSNGCSAPGNWWIKEFTWACHRHDICYFCGQKLGVSRWRCDVNFYKRMTWSCPRSWWRRRECMSAAMFYYRGVRTGGFLPGFWNNNSPSWCFQSWVWYCI